MRTRHALPVLLLLPACFGDDIKPADLSTATPQELTAVVGAASGRQAFGSADILTGMTKGSIDGCPSVELRSDGSVVITGECGDYQGWAVLEPAADGVRISAEGFGTAEGTISGVIDVSLDRTSLSVDLESEGDVSLITHLDLGCEAGGLCTPDDGSWIEVSTIGRVDVVGAWRPEPQGGFLTLIGLQTMTLDFNADGDCVPYTFDGIPEGCL